MHKTANCNYSVYMKHIGCDINIILFQYGLYVRLLLHKGNANSQFSVANLFNIRLSRTERDDKLWPALTLSL